jgi:D-glycero-alpha-D-manno-heptose-7-phosphate kinase
VEVSAAEIRASAPARIDLAGGTLDIWPLYLLHPPACTVHLAIERRAAVHLRARTDGRVTVVSADTGRTLRLEPAAPLPAASLLPLHVELIRHFGVGSGFDLRTDAAVPAGSGLGGSSALALAMAAALNRLRGDLYATARLVELVQNLETIVLGIPTGCQDYLAGVEGGLGVVELRPEGVRRVPLNGARSVAERLVLCAVGAARPSAAGNWEMFRRRCEREPATVAAFAGIARAAASMRSALEAGDLEAGAAAMAEEWEHRKRLAPRISDSSIDALILSGRAAGAQAAKLCGAGGAGGLVFWCGDGRRQQLVRHLESLRVNLLPFEVADRGLILE